MSQRHAHIRAVVFHTLHIGLTNTRLCPYLVKFYMLARLYSLHSNLPHITRHPPPPSSNSRLYIPSFPLANCPDPPPPPLSSRPDIPFLRRPSGSVWFRVFPSPSATVNLHVPPASNRIQPMPCWPPPTLPKRAPRRLGNRSSDCAAGITWMLGG